MIYIYGGKSSIYALTPLTDENGKAHLSYDGELFSALHDTILVTFNYRHDLLATMYLENEFSANLALFDQNVALQFVKVHFTSTSLKNQVSNPRIFSLNPIFLF